MKQYRKWRIGFDIKSIGILFYLPAVVCLIFIAILFCNKDAFIGEYLETGYVQTNYAILFDFILPVILFFNILVLFSEDMKKDTFSFLSSLPISKARFILLRYCKLAGLLLIPYLITLFLFYKQIDCTLSDQASLLNSLFLYLPTSLFFMGLALLLVVVSRKLFYSTIICGGYLLIDASSLGTFLGDKTILLSMYLQQFEAKQISNNRMIFLSLGILFPILAYLVVRSKIYKKLFY